MAIWLEDLILKLDICLCLINVLQASFILLKLFDFKGILWILVILVASFSLQACFIISSKDLFFLLLPIGEIREECLVFIGFFNSLYKYIIHAGNKFFE